MIDPSIKVFCPQCTAEMKRGDVIRLSNTISGRYSCGICGHEEAIYSKGDIQPTTESSANRPRDYSFFTDEERYELRLAFMEMGIQPELN